MGSYTLAKSVFLVGDGKKEKVSYRLPLGKLFRKLVSIYPQMIWLALSKNDSLLTNVRMEL